MELFRANPDNFDLVITDLTMPLMTGEQLAREMIAIKADVPIIICSGHSEAIGSEKAQAMGVKELLMKPISLPEMSQKVRMVLDAALASRESLATLAVDSSPS